MKNFARSIARYALGAPAFALLSSCGGPSEQAKVANAILATVSTVAASGAESVAGGGSSVKCPGGGTLAIGNPTANFGSLAPGQTQPNASADITFSQCVIKVCGDGITLDGAGTKITMSLTAALGGDTSDLDMTVELDSQATTGFISAKTTYAYKVEGSFSKSGFENLEFREASTPTPLSYDGTTYNASDIMGLADGC